MYNLTGLAYYVWFLIVKSLLIAKSPSPAENSVSWEGLLF